MKSLHPDKRVYRSLPPSKLLYVTLSFQLLHIASLVLSPKETNMDGWFLFGLFHPRAAGVEIGGRQFNKRLVPDQ